MLEGVGPPCLFVLVDTLCSAAVPGGETSLVAPLSAFLHSSVLSQRATLCCRMSASCVAVFSQHAPLSDASVLQSTRASQSSGLCKCTGEFSPVSMML